MMTDDPFFIRNLVYGIEDSLISTTGMVVGITFAGLARRDILVAGIVLVLVEALSMSFGSLISEESFMIASKTEYTHIQVAMYATTMFIAYILAGVLVLTPYICGLTRPYNWTASITIALCALFITVSKAHRSKKRAAILVGVGGIILLISIGVGRLLNLAST